MTTKQVSSTEICATKAGFNMNNRIAVSLSLLVLSLMSGMVMASNAITKIGYSTADNGTTEIALTFESAPSAPAAFATEAPPRIVSKPWTKSFAL